MVETTPAWQFYCALSKDPSVLNRFDTADFWDRLVSEMVRRSEETGVGDVKDRLDTLMNSFKLPTAEDSLEEFDGLNHEEAEKFLFVVSLPVIMRGHAIQLKVSSELLSLRVPNLYNLALGLPSTVDRDDTFAFFDCKLRKLFIVLTVHREQAAIEASSSAKQEKTVVVEVVDTKKLENDMLFDIV